MDRDPSDSNGILVRYNMDGGPPPYRDLGRTLTTVDDYWKFVSGCELPLLIVRPDGSVCTRTPSQFEFI
jgi:hypothetical protein